MGESGVRENDGVMIEEFIRRALAEDVGRGDLFARIFEPKPTTAYVVAKSDGVFCGRLYLQALAKLESFHIAFHCNDGERFAQGEKLISLEGDSHTILRIERTLMNMLLHASSIATLTRRYVDIVAPYGVKLLDTRKTRPNLRSFEKYASRVGGATNHRMGLDDALMLKDTHLKTIENLDAFMQEARAKIPFTCKIEIEAESVADAKRFMQAGADIVMLDNMDRAQIEEAVAFRDSEYPHTLLEASGNITLETIEAYAKTGIDAISSGSMIHQANWIDLSMKVL